MGCSGASGGTAYCALSEQLKAATDDFSQVQQRRSLNAWPLKFRHRCMAQNAELLISCRNLLIGIDRGLAFSALSFIDR